MSNVEIDRLVQDRNLVLQPFDDDQVVGYWTQALEAARDAQGPGTSAEGAFQRAYTAALQASAVLAAHDLKVRGTSNHYMTSSRSRS